MAGMKEVANARQGSFGSPSFIDENFFPIDEKAMAWATTEKKTMKSFFSATASKTPGKSNVSSSGGGGSSKPGKRKETTSFVSPPLQNTSEKNPKLTSSKGPEKKKAKTASISSFFGKKNSY